MIISYHFPPDNSIGGQRWAGFAKYLSRNGWEVDLITAAAGADVSAPPGVRAHVVPRHRTLLDLYRAILFRIRPPDTDGASGWLPSASGSPSGRALGRLRTTVSLWLAFPDHARGWIFAAAHTARSLLDTGHYTAVISSGPPHAAHIAAALALRGRSEPLIVDMRDPWARELSRPDNHWSYALGIPQTARWLERTVLRKARMIIANTQAFVAELRAEHPASAVAFVPNGVDLEALPTKPVERFSGFTISYVGTLYHNRTLTPVVAAIRALLDRRPDLEPVLRLRIAGTMEATAEHELREALRSAGISHLAEFVGVVPRGEALELLRRSHLALVLAQAQHLMVPAKLYECVALRVPTLVITEEGSATSQEARRLNVPAVDGADVQGMRRVLEEAADGRLGSGASNVSISHATLAAQIVRLLQDVQHTDTNRT